MRIVPGIVLEKPSEYVGAAKAKSNTEGYAYSKPAAYIPPAPKEKVKPWTPSYPPKVAVKPAVKPSDRYFKKEETVVSPSGVVPGIVTTPAAPTPATPPKVEKKKLRKISHYVVYNSDSDEQFGDFVTENAAQAWINKQIATCDEDGEDQFGDVWDDCDVLPVHSRWNLVG